MKKITIIAITLIALAGTQQAMKWSQSRPAAAERVAATESVRRPAAGEVIGFRDDYNTLAWLGTPYAQAPVGTLRWRAPQPLAPWPETRQALAMGSPCIQFWGPASGLDGNEGEVVGSEDCLHLNIWAPQVALTQPEQSLPVMLWIHGGGNSIGTANTFSGAHLAGSQQVIVVTINYRLGLMGWFSHQALRDTALNLEDASGNYGVLDMIAALRWVQENIAAFGGDPGNVTLFGESAGGANVTALMASPLAKGLFHRAIAQSGSLKTTPLTWAENYRDDDHRGDDSSFKEVLLTLVADDWPDDNRDTGKQRIQHMSSAATMAYLRAKTPEQLLSPFTSRLEAFGLLFTPNNLRDGHVLPKASLMTLFQHADNYNDVPLLLGTTRDEEKLFMALDPQWVDLLFGVIPKIRDLDTYNRIAAYQSDTWRALSVDEPAAVISRHAASHVYAYRFDWDEAPANWLVNLQELIGAGHGIDVSFVFGDFEGPSSMRDLMTAENEAGRLQLSAAMMSYWAEFAYHGTPARGRSGNLPEWTPWHHDKPALMLLDTEIDGGLRMAQSQVTAQSLKDRLAADTSLESQKQRCQLYVSLFLTGFQTTDFWNQQEYEELGQGGCRQFNPFELAR